MPDVHYAFLDESLSLSGKKGIFVVGLLATTRSQHKRLERIPKKLRKQYAKQSQEIKFYEATPQIRKTLLKELARFDVALAIIAVEKEGRQINDNPHNYGLVVAFILAEYLNKARSILDLTVDKRYTSSKSRASFEQTVADGINILSPKGSLTQITHSDSSKDHLTQLADFITGAASQKYNRNDASYLDLVKDKIIIERKISWRELRGSFENKKSGEPWAPIITVQ